MLERVVAGLVAVPFLLGAAASPVDKAQVVFSFQDADIVESSGLVVVGGLVVTTNDSGDSGRVFAVDPEDGRTVGVTSWPGDPTDVEALAPDGRGGVWVGDIGDNEENRDTVQVFDVPVGRGDTAVDIQPYDLAYPDGPHNAETLLREPVTGRIYIATKEIFGGTLYAAPATLSSGHVNELTPVGDVLPVATDGTFLPDGSHIVIRNYATAAVYAFPSLEKVAQLRLPEQPQGEGLAAEEEGPLLLSSEGVHSDVLRVRLPALSDAASPGPSTSQSTSPSTSPTASPTPSPTPGSRTDQGVDAPPTAQGERHLWPWLLGGLVGLGCVVVLVRSLRPRQPPPPG